jgi:DnaJ domain
METYTVIQHVETVDLSSSPELCSGFSTSVEFASATTLSIIIHLFAVACILFHILEQTFLEREVAHCLEHFASNSPLSGRFTTINMSATASGSKATPDGNTKSRDHKQGNQERKYTIEQKTAVIRVRKCASTAFYEILSLEKTASDGDIKKAYRKLSLLTHPDKNGYEGADEAFKS